MIFIGADHGGYTLKEKVKKWLSDWGYEYQDLGARNLDPKDDYPKYAFAVGEKVAESGCCGNCQPHKASPCEARMGILICRSAAGIVMAANKVPGVRAFAAFTPESAKHAREHNDANVIALSGDWFTLSGAEGLKESQAKKILKTFLETEFSGEKRHARRIQQIVEYERR